MRKEGRALCESLSRGDWHLNLCIVWVGIERCVDVNRVYAARAAICIPFSGQVLEQLRWTRAIDPCRGAKVLRPRKCRGSYAQPHSLRLSRGA
eukprot:3108841-Pyramimonas_sp.AAC.1